MATPHYASVYNSMKRQLYSLFDTDKLVLAVTVVDGDGESGGVVGKVDHTTGSIGDNRKVVAAAGTREQLAASSTAAKWVMIVAETDNTGKVVVGGSTVVASLSTRRGVPLNAGEKITLPIDNLQDVYLDVETSGDGVTFLYGAA